MDQFDAILNFMNDFLHRAPPAELFTRTQGWWNIVTHIEARDPKGITNPLITGKGTSSGLASPYDGSGDVRRLNAPTVDETRGQWALYDGFVEVTDQMMEIWRRGASQNKLGDIWMRLVAEGVAVLLEDVKTHFNGTGGTGAQDSAGIAGLLSWISNTGTIFGIDRAVVTALQALILANGGTPRPLTPALIDTAMLTMVEGRGGQPNTMVMSGVQWNLFKAVSSPGTPTIQLSMSAGEQAEAQVLNMGFSPGSFVTAHGTLKMEVVPDHPTNRVEIIRREGVLVEHFRHAGFGARLTSIVENNGKAMAFLVHSMQSNVPNPHQDLCGVTDLTTS